MRLDIVANLVEVLARALRSDPRRIAHAILRAAAIVAQGIDRAMSCGRQTLGRRLQRALGVADGVVNLFRIHVASLLNPTSITDIPETPSRRGRAGGLNTDHVERASQPNC